jgi:hypothetical protein
MERPVVHISEREAVHDFPAVLRLVDAGSDVVVDREGGSVAIRPSMQRPVPSDSAAQQAAERDERDIAIYELHADELNAEAADVLGYQVLTD